MWRIFSFIYSKISNWRKFGADIQKDNIVTVGKPALYILRPYGETYNKRHMVTLSNEKLHACHYTQEKGLKSVLKKQCSSGVYIAELNKKKNVRFTMDSNVWFW